jgi:hypothetical protein
LTTAFAIRRMAADPLPALSLVCCRRWAAALLDRRRSAGRTRCWRPLPTFGRVAARCGEPRLRRSRPAGQRTGLVKRRIIRYNPSFVRHGEPVCALNLPDGAGASRADPTSDGEVCNRCLLAGGCRAASTRAHQPVQLTGRVVA